MGEAVPESADVDFRLDGTGGMSGTGGCNRIRADYALNDGFGAGPVAATRCACIDPALNRLENPLFTTPGSVIGLDVSEEGVPTPYSETGPAPTAKRQGAT